MPMTRTQALLTRVAEECCETGQRATKAAFFGRDEKQPGHDRTNAQRLMDEFKDIIALMDMLIDAGYFGDVDLSDEAAHRHIAEKKAKVEKYLEYQRTCGNLE